MRFHLSSHVHALETCVYCPKLCRAACPVSNVEASETLTPWGKMSLAYFVHRGDVPRDEEHAKAAWACAGCLGCRERCEHHNDVAHVLRAARADFTRARIAPAAARSLARRWPEHQRKLAVTAAAIERPGGNPRAALLVGCSYLRYSPDAARAAVRVAEWLVGGPVRILRGCCGLPWLEAGEEAEFAATARALADEARGAGRLLVADPGCARTLLEEYPRIGVDPGPVGLMVDELSAAIDRLPFRALELPGLRIHDSCQLTRALGRDELPRRLLERLTGRAPGELPRSRRAGECCGAGGLLPLTQPATSRAIAADRIREHRELGGGSLVTTCGGSLHRFRQSGEPAIDWLELVARALGLGVGPSGQGAKVADGR